MLAIIGIIIFVVGFIVASQMKDTKYDNRTTARALVRLIVSIIAVVAIAISCVAYVPTGYTGIVKRMGVIQDTTLDAGISFKTPVDTIITMDNREQRHSFELEAFSRDIQEVQLVGSVNLNINKSTAMALYREVGENYVKILVAPRIQEDIKVVIGNYNAEELIAHRSTLSESIVSLLQNDLSSKGINIISVAIENIDFSDSYTSSVEAKQVATQEKLKATTQEEQKTMEAEQAAERARISAQAAADVAKIQADADAYSIQAKAEAEASANEKINKSLTLDLIKYIQAQNWDGRLPMFNGESAIPIIDFDIDNLN